MYIYSELKNALIITYYWPPSGGGGVQRWLKFTRYLPDYGWNCLVCTPENPDFDLKDETLEEEVHPDTEVLKIPIWEPYQLFRRLKGTASLTQGVTPQEAGSLTRFIRGNLLLPDPRRFWVRPVTRFLKEYLKGRKIDVIITTGPPHSMHLIGKKLHKKTGIPWVADFRDPWSRWDMLDEFNTTSLARQWHFRMEAAVVKKATGVLTVSEQWAGEFNQDHGIRPEVITNGFDKEDLSTEDTVPETFQLLHAGLLNSFRDAPALWHSLSVLLKAGKLPADITRVVLKGMIDSSVRQNVGQKLGKNHISFGNAVSHRQIFRLYNDSWVLILLMNNTPNSKGHLPGKLFEYLAAGRWILAIGDPEGEAARILAETKTGTIHHWEDREGIQDTLMLYYDFFQKKIMPSKSGIEKFSRKKLTEDLSQYLNNLSGSHP